MILRYTNTAWKVSVFQVFFVRIFPHSDWIRNDIPYFSVFSLNGGKYGPEKLRIWTLFTQRDIYFTKLFNTHLLPMLLIASANKKVLNFYIKS